MIRTAFSGIALIDTSAVIALHDTLEPFHRDAVALFNSGSVAFAVLNVTRHECYTRVRYASTQRAAIEHYEFMCGEAFHALELTAEDEIEAKSIVNRYADQAFSFHDALCAAVMKRVGIARAFSFDRDFAILGFELVPGVYRQ